VPSVPPVHRNQARHGHPRRPSAGQPGSRVLKSGPRSSYVRRDSLASSRADWFQAPTCCSVSCREGGAPWSSRRLWPSVLQTDLLDACVTSHAHTSLGSLRRDPAGTDASGCPGVTLTIQRAMTPCRRDFASCRSLLISFQARVACQVDRYPGEPGRQHSCPGDPQDVPEPGDHANEGRTPARSPA
jgi:hypothetical protein